MCKPFSISLTEIMAMQSQTKHPFFLAFSDLDDVLERSKFKLSSGRVPEVVLKCYDMAMDKLAQPSLTDKQCKNITNYHVWEYIIEKGPVGLEWFEDQTRVDEACEVRINEAREACARLRTLRDFMQDRMNNHALSNPDAHNLVQCVDAILQAYDEHINESSDDESF